MKRRLIIIAVFLLAGAVVNVAVAWGCAYRNGLYSDDWYWVSAPENDRFWLERRPHEWESCMLIGVRRHSGLGRNLTGAMGRTVVNNQARINEAEFGLPLRSLRWTSQRVWLTAPLTGDSDDMKDRWLAARTTNRSPTITMSGHVLPLLPMWPGFAVNTVFYATVLWLLIPGPLVLRRFIRVKRGLCPKCAYPMGESAVCSECGKALPRRVGA